MLTMLSSRLCLRPALLLMALLASAFGQPGLAQTAPYPGAPLPKVRGPLTWDLPRDTQKLALPDGSVILAKPPVAGAPRFEVWLPPGISGSPTKIERFQIQVPLAAFSPPYAPRPVVVGFHFFGVSEQAVFNQTLPQLCEAEGWYLIAPYGVSDVNFANVQSQESLDAILNWIEQFVDINNNRLYAVGFSMGGLNALSYALRHQEKFSGRRFAAVASLMGTVDPVYAYNIGSPTIQTLMQHPDVFGTTPSADVFPYDRVAAARLDSQAVVDELRAPVGNLIDTPIYLGINLADPSQDLIVQMQALSNYLQSRGFPVTVDSFLGLPSHAWGNFDNAEVIQFFKGKVVPGLAPVNGPPLDVYADRVTGVRFCEVRAIEPNTVARVDVDLGAAGSNLFLLGEIRGVQELYVDVSKLGIDTAQTVVLSTYGEVLGQSGSVFVLSGYAQAPSSVTVYGNAPIAWSHDALLGELSVQPLSSSNFAITTIVP